MKLLHTIARGVVLRNEIPGQVHIILSGKLWHIYRGPNEILDVQLQPQRAHTKLQTAKCTELISVHRRRIGATFAQN